MLRDSHPVLQLGKRERQRRSAEGDEREDDDAGEDRVARGEARTGIGPNGDRRRLRPLFPLLSPLLSRRLRLARHLGGEPSRRRRQEPGQVKRRPGGEEETHHRHGPRRVPRPLERDGEQEEVEKVDTAPRQSQAERYRGEDDRGLVVQEESRPLHRGQLRDRHQDVIGIPSRPPGDHVERREQPVVSVRVQSAEDETRDARNQRGNDPRPEPCPLELLPPGRPDEGVGEERAAQAERHQVRRMAVRPHEDHRGEKVDQFLAVSRSNTRSGGRSSWR